MSMLSAQCDELRTMAAMLTVKGLPEVASVVRDAADTITELRGALQVASVDYRHLSDENAKLRQENQSIGMAAYELGRNSLVTENAKLRELVKEMRVCLEDECKRCHEWGDICDLEHKLRELGIKVEP